MTMSDRDAKPLSFYTGTYRFAEIQKEEKEYKRALLEDEENRRLSLAFITLYERLKEQTEESETESFYLSYLISLHAAAYAEIKMGRYVYNVTLRNAIVMLLSISRP